MRETNFKQTEIGLIPYDWEVCKLGNVSNNIFYGIAARAVPYDGKVKYIRITDIDDRSREFSPTPLCSPEVYTEDYFVHPGDILFARTGSSVGKTYLYTQNDGNLVFAGFLIKVGITEACPEFIFYLTQTSSYWEWVAAQSVRTGQPGINAIQLSELPIPLPARSEQTRIGRILKQLDGLISGLKKLIDKKRAIKAGAMSQLLSGKLRLPGFSEPWISTSLDELGVLLSNNTLSRENLTESGTIGNIHYGDILTKFGAILDLDNTDIPFIHPQMSSKFLKSHLAKEGDVIFADTAEDETVGKATELVNVKDRAIVSGLHTFWFRPLTKFASKYLGYAVNSHEFHQQAIPVISGTKVCSISKPNLLSFTLTYPSDLEEQKAIAKVLTDMDDEISALETKLKKYEQLKKGMMQQLLTGKIRLVSPNESLS